jgi:hypothetical protein
MRTWKLSTAILGSLAAGFAFTAIAETPVQAEDCLAAPDNRPVQGGHWYYRIDHAKRHCWYVRGEDQEVEQLTSSSAKRTAPPSPPLQRSVADARAEIPPAAEIAPDPKSPWPDNASGSSVTTAATTIASNDSVQNNPSIPSSSPMNSSSSPMSTTPSATLAERWSDHPNANNPTEAAPPNVVASITPQPEPAAAAVKQDGLPAGHFAWMSASALGATLVLLGIATGAVARFRRGKKPINRRDRNREAGNAPPGDEVSAPVHSHDEAPQDEAPMNWIRIARETQEINRRRDEVEQLLAQARESTAG